MSEISKVKRSMNLAKWTGIIQACQSSDMFVIDWCRVNNVNVKSYYYWLKQIREHTISNFPAEVKSTLTKVDQSTPVTFKKLEVKTPVPDAVPAVVIRLPYATLELTNSASQQTVEAVLLALKSTC